jgi:nucleoside-diphosphate-sugar epimerase
MKKTIFLTGSKGFIGSHLLKALTEYEVHCAGYNEIPRCKYDYIIHLAATTTTSASFLPELFENNIVYAKQIMSMPGKKIYASSTSAEELTNPYAYTKRYLEYLGKGSVGLRFFNVYGSDNNKGIIRKALQCAKTGEVLQVQGGCQVRDFIYIDDVVQAIIHRLDAKSGIYDIGTGKGRKIKDVLELIGCKYALSAMAETDMKYSVAYPGISGCLSLEDGLIKMENETTDTCFKL